jgi:pimeloyl-ACP methyl ester carboxylesterase
MQWANQCMIKPRTYYQTIRKQFYLQLLYTNSSSNRINSLVIAAKIPGAWLVQIKGAGHDLMFQYPDKFNKVLQTFLSTTRG